MARFNGAVSITGLDRIAELLKDDKGAYDIIHFLILVTRVVVMTGAGISTSAGIPDFRSPVTGLYASLEKYDLPYPEALFEISYFRKNPQPFYTLYQEMYPDGAKYRPTLTHTFFKLLQKKGKLLRVFTQNSASFYVADASRCTRAFIRT